MKTLFKKLIPMAILSVAIVTVPITSLAHERGHRDNYSKNHNPSHGRDNYKYSRHYKNKYDKRHNHRNNHWYAKNDNYHYHNKLNRYSRVERFLESDRNGLFIYFRD